MPNVQRMLHSAKKSWFSLRCLNWALAWGVPFNRPHKIKVSKISDDALECQLPYVRQNRNHLRGIHACAIATVGEFAAGMCLLLHFNPSHYRFIMSHLEVKYHYQARMKITARAQCSIERVAALQQQLVEVDSVEQVMQTEIIDVKDNHIATVITHWQLKPWGKVTLK